MSDLMTATVTGTGTQDEVVEALLGNMRKAYLCGDVDGAVVFARQLLVELADPEDNLFVYATAHLFLGWATMVHALKAARVDVNLYRNGLQEAAGEINAVLHILLEHEELFAERVIAECYLALIAYHLGEAESGARKLELVLAALTARPVVGTAVRSVYITTLTTIARDFLGVAVPSLEGDDDSQPEVPVSAVKFDATVDREPLILTDEIRQQCAALMAKGDAQGMLEITSDLGHIDPTKLTTESWFMIRRWHAWALVILGERATGAERNDYFSVVLPLVRELADEAFNARNTENFVAMAAELSLVLRALRLDDEADMRWRILCVFVAEAPEPLRAKLHNEYVRKTLDRITNLGLATGTRVLPMA